MSRRHWFIALLIALGMHGSLLAWQAAEPVANIGAVAVGEQGLDSGYGLAGSYADQLQPPPVQEPPAETNDISQQTKSQPEEINAPQPLEPEIAADTESLPEQQGIAPVIEVAQAPAQEISTDTPPEQVAESKSRPEPNSESSPQSDAEAKPQPAENAVRATGTDVQRTLGGKKVGDARSYYSLLMAWLNQYKTYPAEAKKQKQQGVVSVQFTVNSNGDVVSRSIKKSSGHQLLDTAALAMFDAATPLPPIPEFMQRDRLTLVLPVEFSLITNNVFKE